MISYVGNKYKLALRGTFFYLLIGGIINIIGIIFSFWLKMNFGNEFYRSHYLWLYIDLAEWIVFIFSFGLKYVENIGYIDDYDHVHYIRTYFRLMSLIMLYIFIPPLLSAGGVGAVLSYFTSLCYEPNLLFANLINNKVQTGNALMSADTMNYWPQVAGMLIMLSLNLIAFIPFYALGRHNRREDLKNGFKMRIKS